ncbi:hypothetical protein EVAR_37757_1 [Eumeta japonica]|uniref:Uncharacterized protein n=1 Tax=Eumeta variegata TaxID=151549 RepID=A0A4C1WND2_EUMVA|nr:hypothetical protein EVAR_37757_1 [Eumeta japonica]
MTGRDREKKRKGRYGSKRERENENELFHFAYRPIAFSNTMLVAVPRSTLVPVVLSVAIRHTIDFDQGLAFDSETGLDLSVIRFKSRS